MGRIGGRYVHHKLDKNPFRLSQDEISKFFDDTILNCFGRTFYSSEQIDYDLKPILKRQRRPSRELDLVMVSSEIDVKEKNGDLVPKSFEDLRKILVPGDELFRRRWHDSRKSELTGATAKFEGSEFHPEIICFPEFAYPPPADARTYARGEEILGHRNADRGASAIARKMDVANTYIDRSSYGRNRASFEGMVTTTLEGKGEPFVFMGSFHCPFDFYNVGVIFPLGGSIEPEKVQLASRDKYGDLITTSINPPLLTRKRFPSRRLEEYTRVPANNDIQTFMYHDVHIAVVICSDVLDINQLFFLSKLSADRSAQPAVDVILVPSFNYSRAHVTMCRELSFLTNCFVVMVNANDQLRINGEDIRDKQKLGTELNSDVFLCGYSMRDLIDFEWADAGMSPPVQLIEETETESVTGSRTYRVRLNFTSRRYLRDMMVKARRDHQEGNSQTRANDID